MPYPKKAPVDKPPPKKPGLKKANATSFKKGVGGNPKGRKPGTRNHYNKLTNEQRQQIAAITGGLTPLDLFISVMRSSGENEAKEQVPLELRLQAARDAAPYLHKRQPIAIEGGDLTKPINFMDVAALRKLSTKELAVFVELLKKAGTNIIGMDEE